MSELLRHLQSSGFRAARGLMPPLVRLVETRASGHRSENIQGKLFNVRRQWHENRNVEIIVL